MQTDESSPMDLQKLKRMKFLLLKHIDAMRRLHPHSDISMQLQQLEDIDNSINEFN